MHVDYNGVSVCMCMRESLASSCGFMPRSPSRHLACSLVSAKLEIVTMRMSLDNRKTIFRDHSDRVSSAGMSIKIYLHATTCSSLV